MRFDTVTHIDPPTYQQLKIRLFKNPYGHRLNWQSTNRDMSVTVWPIDTIW